MTEGKRMKMLTRLRRYSDGERKEILDRAYPNIERGKQEERRYAEMREARRRGGRLPDTADDDGLLRKVHQPPPEPEPEPAPVRQADPARRSRLDTPSTVDFDSWNRWCQAHVRAAIELERRAALPIIKEAIDRQRELHLAEMRDLEEATKQAMSEQRAMHNQIGKLREMMKTMREEMRAVITPPDEIIDLPPLPLTTRTVN
jgi:hypothetical protein